LNDQPLNYRLSGKLDLAFEHSAQLNRTKLNVLAQVPPLKVIRAFEVEHGASLVHLHNVSGGVLGGDKLELNLCVGSEAKAQITTTSATRIYKNSANRPASTQISVITVERGGWLEMLPDPLIPYAGANYQQRTTIDLAEDAGLFWWETVAPGREARGEVFAYDTLGLDLEIRVDRQPIALESIRLQPHKDALTSHIRLGQYRHFSTFYICRVGVSAAQWTKLESTLIDTAKAISDGETIWGVSTLSAHGLVVRALSLNSRAIAQGLLTFWGLAKRALYGMPVVPPRKVY
jgi:urease accessory protein